MMAKKVEKSKIEQNILFFVFKMEKRVTEPQFLSTMSLSQQIAATKEPPWGLMVLLKQNERETLKVTTVTHFERQSRFNGLNNNYL